MPTLRAKPNRPTVIYVGDRPDDAVLLKHALEAQTPEVDLAVLDSDPALRYFTIKAPVRDALPPLCILIDRRVALEGGRELLRFVRGVTEYDEMPILVLAFEQERASLAAAVSVPAECVLLKPVDWAGFLTLGERLATIAPARREQEASPSLDARHVCPGA